MTAAGREAAATRAMPPPPPRPPGSGTVMPWLGALGFKRQGGAVPAPSGALRPVGAAARPQQQLWQAHAQPQPAPSVMAEAASCLGPLSGPEALAQGRGEAGEQEAMSSPARSLGGARAGSLAQLSPQQLLARLRQAELARAEAEARERRLQGERTVLAGLVGSMLPLVQRAAPDAVTPQLLQQAQDLALLMPPLDTSADGRATSGSATRRQQSRPRSSSGAARASGAVPCRPSCSERKQSAAGDDHGAASHATGSVGGLPAGSTEAEDGLPVSPLVRRQRERQRKRQQEREADSGEQQAGKAAVPESSADAEPSSQRRPPKRRREPQEPLRAACEQSQQRGQQQLQPAAAGAEAAEAQPASPPAKRRQHSSRRQQQEAPAADVALIRGPKGQSTEAAQQVGGCRCAAAMSRHPTKLPALNLVLILTLCASAVLWASG